jgi:2-methylcitrate dehydratase PrpD
MRFAHALAERIGGDVLPSSACRDLAVRAAIDILGVALAGAATETGRIAARTVIPGPGDCHLIGGTACCDPLNAALVNGTAAHALDFDDMTEHMMGHPTVALMPPLLALAEHTGAGGAEVIRAYLIGFETACKLGRAVTYTHHDRGWHGTATLGLFGAVAACCALTQQDTDTTATALAIATSLAAGLRANFGSMTKPLHAGHQGRNAIFATLAAAEGFTANASAFEHAQGFFDVFLGTGIANPDRALEDWFDPPEIVEPGVCFKLYPSGAHTHPFIEMTRRLAREHGLAPDDIARIDVLSEKSRHDHINRPEPRSGLEAKWSVHYVIARALHDGMPRLDHFTDAGIAEPAIRATMAKVHAAPHPEMDESWADKYGGEIAVTTTAGARHEAKIVHMIARGPDNPLSEEELESKFLDCAGRALAVDQARELFAALKELATADSVAPIMALTQPRAA